MARFFHPLLCICESKILTMKDFEQIESDISQKDTNDNYASKENEHYEKLFDCLGDFNKKWVQTAPCLGVVLAKKHFSVGGKIYKHRFYDSGAFMSTTTQMATQLPEDFKKQAYKKPDCTDVSEFLFDDKWDTHFLFKN